ncbi:MAG: PhnA domain-containing protein [Imperialibacter sp.]|uniref:PhnA domain-containing protein n=1 Tax=Imperialibacter sp. TaxID=2038411 RepID=UPI0032F0370A
MSVASELEARSESKCELCQATENLSTFLVSPGENETVDNSILVCGKCQAQLDQSEASDSNHWRCLNDTIWSEVSAVKVQAYRILYDLRAEGWPQDLLDMMYMEESELKWAQATLMQDGEVAVVHKDSNGVTLANGDTVVLVKDLDVKGGGFTAKRGTAVRNISLVVDNAEQIEGKVNGQQLVLLTKFLKKS